MTSLTWNTPPRLRRLPPRPGGPGACHYKTGGKIPGWNRFRSPGSAGRTPPSWDDIVHVYLRAVEHRGRVSVLYSDTDYGCEWDYDWRNKRFEREGNTKFAVNLVGCAMTS